MKRLTFLRNLLGASLLPSVALARPVTTDTEAGRIRQELLQAWAMSERTTLVTAEQMPAEGYEFKYTPEAMTFAEQWRHCCLFTAGQLAGRLGVINPYETRKLPKVMNKAQVLDELKTLYAFVRQTIETVPDAKLVEMGDFMGGKIPNWRLLYAMENHIIHHRGQCIVYLRLKGITPEGYLGW
ncbi:MAG: DinB family protein [Sphingobacteriaceae bacterium]|nr:DinB family protein [Cytophagaceae bacterium]